MILLSLMGKSFLNYFASRHRQHTWNDHSIKRKFANNTWTYTNIITIFSSSLSSLVTCHFYILHDDHLATWNKHIKSRFLFSFFVCEGQLENLNAHESKCIGRTCIKKQFLLSMNLLDFFSFLFISRQFAWWMNWSVAHLVVKKKDK